MKFYYLKTLSWWKHQDEGRQILYLNLSIYLKFCNNLKTWGGIQVPACITMVFFHIP